MDSTNSPQNLAVSLPFFFRNSSLDLIIQGAEAFIFKTNYLLSSIPAALKFRPSKPYRHPTLDSRLTKHRILSEARVLVRCRKNGVYVPAVYMVNEQEAWILIEWIEGEAIRTCIGKWLVKQRETGSEENQDNEALKGLMKRIGSVIGKMHSAGVVHGDLTTSNLMLKRSGGELTRTEPLEKYLDGDIIIIDFGLATQTSQDEDRAVDLYVLERAFGSTHPQTQHLFTEVLNSYGNSFKGANTVLRKLEEVRMRGRKRSMLG